MQRFLLMLVCLIALVPTCHSATDSAVPRPSIDLGWIVTVERDAGWMVVSSSHIPWKGDAFRPSDVIVSIDGRTIATLNAVSVAYLLHTVNIDAKHSVVLRGGKTVRLNFAPSDRLIAYGLRVHSFRNVRLYQRTERLPSFNLPDVSGKVQPINFVGQWTLLRVGILGCDKHDLDAFNEIAKTSELQVVAVSVFEEPHEVERVMVDNRYDFPVFVAGGRTIGGPRDSDFAVATLPTGGTATYVLVRPPGDIAFV